MLSWALKYLDLKLSVIPLKPRGKDPLISWKEFQSRRATPEEVKEWFLKWPDANVGIVTGGVSGVAVVDLDGTDGLKSANNLGLMSSIVSLTGNGKHLWYKNVGTIQNAVRLMPGVDVRGEGGYVVAPPSIHESGRRYRFLTPFVSIGSLPQFPNNLATTPIAPLDIIVEKEESWIAKALGGMKNGNIDDTLFIVCSRLRADGYSPADARTLLAHHAERAGASPGHLDDKIKNVWERYEPNQKREMGNAPIRTFSDSRSDLVIHSPTNPDSLHQFEQLHNSRAELESKAYRLKTGYTKLDAMLQGGLKSSRLFTVAARTGVGKTNWLLGVAREVCRAGKVVLLFSTEMPYGEIWQRYLATLDNPEEFKQHKFYVCDSFAPNLEKVEEAINALKPDLFMFDHINHVSEEQRELGTFMQGLNFIRRKYECAGIVTAQLNRSADWVDIKTGEKVTPRMSMIKGSGTIEQASSRVLLLSETRVTPEGTEIVGNLDKNDNGDKGLVHFMLKKNPYRMEEL